MKNNIETELNNTSQQQDSLDIKPNINYIKFVDLAPIDNVDSKDDYSEVFKFAIRVDILIPGDVEWKRLVMHVEMRNCLLLCS